MVVTFGWLDNYVNFSSCYVITEGEHALMLFCKEPATETIMHVEYIGICNIYSFIELL